jgi:hypothetical protein
MDKVTRMRVEYLFAGLLLLVAAIYLMVAIVGNLMNPFRGDSLPGYLLRHQMLVAWFPGARPASPDSGQVTAPSDPGQ